MYIVFSMLVLSTILEAEAKLQAQKAATQPFFVYVTRYERSQRDLVHSCSFFYQVRMPFGGGR